MPRARDRIRDWPLWHFAQLEAALNHQNDKAAREALSNLERLGIEVRFRLPPRRIRSHGRRLQNAGGGAHA
jgi:hypothetical protein